MVFLALLVCFCLIGTTLSEEAPAVDFESVERSYGSRSNYGSGGNSGYNGRGGNILSQYNWLGSDLGAFVSELVKKEMFEVCAESIPPPGNYNSGGDRSNSNSGYGSDSNSDSSLSNNGGSYGSGNGNGDTSSNGGSYGSSSNSGYGSNGNGYPGSSTSGSYASSGNAGSYGTNSNNGYSSSTTLGYGVYPAYPTTKAAGADGVGGASSATTAASGGISASTSSTVAAVVTMSTATTATGGVIGSTVTTAAAGNSGASSSASTKPSTVSPSSATQPGAPVTQAPITQAPVTQAPVTQAPVTQAPATQAPTAVPNPSGPGGSCSSPQDTSCANTQNTILTAINAVRSGVGAADMLAITWDPAAQASAQGWADKCQGLMHSQPADRNQCGENLFVATGSFFSWDKVFSESWDAEVKNFAWGAQCDLQMTGHYTQDVWATTNKIGCGFNKCGGTGANPSLYVCHYCPAGNIQGANGKSDCKPYQLGTPANGGVCGKCGGMGSATCPNGLCTSISN